MKQSNLTPAQSVIATYPTFVELLTKSENNAGLVYSEEDLIAIEMIWADSEDLAAEQVAHTVNHLVRSFTGTPLFNSFDMSTPDSITEVKTASGDLIQLKREQFESILKVFWCSYLGVKLNDAQYDSYINFISSDNKIRQVCD
jgi:hypothetical protein